MSLQINYAIFAVRDWGDPTEREMEFVEGFDEEIHDHEIEEIIQRFQPDLEYDYIIIEKQYHRA